MQNPTTPPRTSTRSITETGSPSFVSMKASLANLKADFVAGGSPSSIRTIGSIIGVPPPSSKESTPFAAINILFGTHLVLQTYQVNPALIIQIFSQVLLWISAEMFNRILTLGKRYLCRSKASHIERNLRVVEDWVIQSGLPVQIYYKHFEKVLQLLEVSPCRGSFLDGHSLFLTREPIALPCIVAT